MNPRLVASVMDLRIRSRRTAYRSGPHQVFLSVIVSVLLLTAGAVQAKVLYQWINDQGAVETSYSIPPSIVHRGYSILDGDTMRPLRVVPPQMTEAQYAAKLQREKQLDQCEKTLERLNFLYQNLSDIDDAEVVALRQLDARMRNAQQNLTNARRNLSDQETKAAQVERQGKTITKSQLEEIERANSALASLEREIQRRQHDKEQMMLDFDRDRALFQINECNAEAILLANTN